MSKKKTRRSFLKGCAVTAGGVAGAVIGAEVITPMVIREKMEFDENTGFFAQYQPKKNPPLTENLEVDVAIIGGGYTGLSAAYHIKEMFPKKEVVILEAKEIGHGGSGRNGGMILPQPFNEYMQIYSDSMEHKVLYDMTVKGMGEMVDLINAQDIDCDLHMDGILQVISEEKKVGRFKEYFEEAKSMGFPLEFWDRDRTAQEIGTDVYFASIYDPNGGEVNPMKMVHALKKAAEGAGVKIYEEAKVIDIDEGEVVSLTVGGAEDKTFEVKAKSIVLATNGYTSKLGYFKNRLLAFHAQLAVTTPLDEKVFSDIGWKRRIPFSDTKNYLFHLGTTADNRILIGGGNADYFFNNGIIYRRDIGEVEDILLEELVRIYPGLNGVEFDSIWDGVLGFSLDFNQSVGTMGRHNNIHYGLAYCGHGVNLSFLFGKIVSDLYAGEGKKWEKTPFLNNRLPYMPPEPLRWLGVQGYMAYYKMLDR